MEKNEFFKLYHENTEDIEFHPDRSRMECFLAMSKRAGLICKESKKNHKGKEKISDSERVQRQGESSNQIKDNDIESPPDWSALYCLAAAAERVSVLEKREEVKYDRKVNLRRDEQQPDAKNHQLNTAKIMGETKKRHASDDIDNYNNNENEYQDKPRKNKVKMEGNIIQQQKNHKGKEKISDSERVHRQGESSNQIKDNDTESPPDWSAFYCLAAAAERVSVLERREKVKYDSKVNFRRDEQQPDAKNHQLNTAKNMGQTKKRHASDDIDNYNNNENEYQDKPRKKKVKMEGNIIQQQKNSEISSMMPQLLHEISSMMPQTLPETSSMMPQTLPPEHMNALETLADGESIEDVNLVFQKKIFQTDISKTHNRLSLPKNLYKCSFLREEEVQYLKTLKENNQKGTNSIEVDVIEPSLETCKLDLREWAISNGIYVLTKGWNKLVERNSIKVNQILEIWTARVDQKLCFLLVRIPTNNS